MAPIVLLPIIGSFTITMSKLWIVHVATLATLSILAEIAGFKKTTVLLDGICWYFGIGEVRLLLARRVIMPAITETANVIGTVIQYCFSPAPEDTPGLLAYLVPTPVFSDSPAMDYTLKWIVWAFWTFIRPFAGIAFTVVISIVVAQGAIVGTYKSLKNKASKLDPTMPKDANWFNVACVLLHWAIVSVYSVSSYAMYCEWAFARYKSCSTW